MKLSRSSLLSFFLLYVPATSSDLSLENVSLENLSKSINGNIKIFINDQLKNAMNIKLCLSDYTARL